MTGHMLVVVPLPGLVSVVPPLGGDAPPPHVPLVETFADDEDPDEGVLEELRSYFADVVAFEVELSELSQFPGGAVYLAPEPATPFRRLARGVTRLFPEASPPRSTFDLVPHLTVPAPPGLSFDDLRRSLQPWLPVTTMAREAALWWRDEHGPRTVATFPFGTSAA